MSWSLELRNGDLTIGGTRLGAVTGPQKLVQDLRCALLERMGTDPSHPSFGSLIDGGRTPDGVEHVSLIGGSNWDRIAIQVESEIRRIVSEHQDKQLARTQADRVRYGKSTLSRGEVVLSIRSLDLVQVQDTLIARVLLEVGDGVIQTLNIPLSSEPVITR
jgi:hypothetical protein